MVITGDIHSSWVHDVKTDFANPSSDTVAVELVGTSITSEFPAAFIAPVIAALPDNPHTRFFDGLYRGYVRCTVTEDAWLADFRAVPTILDENAAAFTLASFTVRDGQPGAVPA
jgi:alkaline phosphatase D